MWPLINEYSSPAVFPVQLRLRKTTFGSSNSIYYGGKTSFLPSQGEFSFEKVPCPPDTRFLRCVRRNLRITTIVCAAFAIDDVLTSNPSRYLIPPNQPTAQLLNQLTIKPCLQLASQYSINKLPQQQANQQIIIIHPSNFKPVKGLWAGHFDPPQVSEVGWTPPASLRWGCSPSRAPLGFPVQPHLRLVGAVCNFSKTRSPG